MTANQLRTKYLDFFKSKQHSIIPSASLIPENDPTVLFTTAGMHPLVPYLMGEKHPEGNRLTDVQKCIRTGDIDEVGDATHHTFFEMLGNWGLGSYFKKKAIEMSWEFLTEVLKLDKNKIAVTVFGGDDRVPDVPKDDESVKIWESLGIPKHKIVYMEGGALEGDDNWWGPAGETGPCGPCTEMFVWIGKDDLPPEDSNPKDDGNNWVEIWNDVFMEYNKTKDTKFEPLAQKNVDTGMGLERTLAIINNSDDNYTTELFLPIIQKIEKLSRASINLKKNVQTEEEFENTGIKYGNNKKAFRIVADHIKAAVMILGDERGIGPSNTGAGYVLRRLIRRAVRYAKMIGIKDSHFTALLAEEVIKIYQDVYPEIKDNATFIKDELVKEEQKFVLTLERGLKELEKMIGVGIKELGEYEKPYATTEVDAKKAFYIYQTYGFPLEMIQEELEKRDLFVDEDRFKEEAKQHSELSKTASAGQFKGGLADASEETKKLHTTAHLMLEAMRRVIGDHIQQKGSNINAERLRFDFSHGEKLTDEQKEEIEKIVNEQIKADLPVSFQEMTLDEARKLGATGVFDQKYGEKVKVYSIGKFSKEICGGPHVERTGELGEFKIKKEQSSSAGVRRIKAVIE